MLGDAGRWGWFCRGVRPPGSGRISAIAPRLAQEEDIQLLKVVWSGARGENRCTRTRTLAPLRHAGSGSKPIGKTYRPELPAFAHSTGDTTRRANVIAALEDETFGAEVDAERATLRVAADAPGDPTSPQPLK